MACVDQPRLLGQPRSLNVTFAFDVAARGGARGRRARRKWGEGVYRRRERRHDRQILLGKKG